MPTITAASNRNTTVATGFYLGGPGRSRYDNPHKFTSMEPYLWGDFLAGALAPLAFLWLIIGYARQGKALQDQIAQSRVQAQALKSQARGTQQLVLASRRQEINLARRGR